MNMAATGLVRAGKLETDMRQIMAAADQRPYEDEFGNLYEAHTRESVLESLGHLEVIKVNLQKMKEVIVQVSEASYANRGATE